MYSPYKRITRLISNSSNNPRCSGRYFVEFSNGERDWVPACIIPRGLLYEFDKSRDDIPLCLARDVQSKEDNIPRRFIDSPYSRSQLKSESVPYENDFVDEDEASSDMSLSHDSRRNKEEEARQKRANSLRAIGYIGFAFLILFFYLTEGGVGLQEEVAGSWL